MSATSLTLQPFSVSPYALNRKFNAPSKPISSSIEVTRKTDHVAKRILQSPLFHSTVATAALLTFTAIVLTGIVALAVSVFAPILAITAIALTIFVIKNKDKIWFELSLMAVKEQATVTHTIHKIIPSVRERLWFNKIELPSNNKYEVYLSALPLESMNHRHVVLKLAEKKAGVAVLTVVKDFENQTSGLAGDPVRPADWKASHVAQKQIEVFDLMPVPQNQLEEGVDFIENQLNENKIVVVHCKAGRGRSAMMVIAHLLRYRREEVEQTNIPGNDLVAKAIEIVRRSRPQIYLNEHQIAALYNFYKTYL